MRYPGSEHFDIQSTLYEQRRHCEFLKANLRTRVSYLSVIDQNNNINCLLHFYSCFSIEFSHSAVMIFPTKIVPVSAWISGGVVEFENQPPSCFQFNAKIIMCLKYRHNNVPKVELEYQEYHTCTLYLCCRSFLKNANWTWKLQSDFYDFIKFSAKRQPLSLLLPTTSATAPNNYDVKTFEMK